MVDVGDEDRHALGGDATGEALPDRNPHALLDLLLDALGGAGHQLASGRVVEEDRHGVDTQGLPDADQQLVQELLQAQLGERRIAQPGERLDLVRGSERGLDGRQDRLARTRRLMVRILQGHGAYCAPALANGTRSTVPSPVGSCTHPMRGAKATTGIEPV